MKKFCLKMILALTAAFSGTSVFAEAANTCALWEIAMWEGEMIYYSEYHVDCESEPQSAYLIGNYDWPLDCGSEGCDFQADYSTSNDRSGQMSNSKGLVFAKGWIPNTDQFQMPAGPARRFSSQISREAVAFDHDADPATPDKSAYCYVYLVSPKALGGNADSKAIKFGFEALEAPKTAAKHAKVVRKIHDFAYHIELEGNMYLVYLR